MDVVVVVVMSVCGSGVSLVALRWRIGLHRHKCDRVIDLAATAYRRGGIEDAVAMSKALESLMGCTGPEPCFQRPVTVRSVPKLRAAGAEAGSVASRADRDEPRPPRPLRRRL